MITILIVDDFAPFQISLRYMLEATKEIQVVATASNGVEGIAQARIHCPDIAMVDISMPLMDGIEATRQIKECCRSTRVMILSILDHPEYVQRALEVGAAAFVLKDAIGRDLLAAVRALSTGKQYFSPAIAKIAELYIDRKNGNSWVV